MVPSWQGRQLPALVVPCSCDRLVLGPDCAVRAYAGCMVGPDTKLVLVWECRRCGCATLEDRCWYCGRPKGGEMVMFEGDRDDSQFELWGGEGP
jgi:hypothetical protein